MFYIEWRHSNPCLILLFSFMVNLLNKIIPATYARVADEFFMRIKIFFNISESRTIGKDKKKENRKKKR